MLGVFSGIQRQEVELELEKGDLLVLYTDGVIEEENSQHVQFSVQRLKKFLETCYHLHMDAETIKDQLILELKRFSDKDQFNDDVTFIVIHILTG